MFKRLLQSVRGRDVCTAALIGLGVLLLFGVVLLREPRSITQARRQWVSVDPAQRALAADAFETQVLRAVNGLYPVEAALGEPGGAAVEGTGVHAVFLDERTQRLVLHTDALNMWVVENLPVWLAGRGESWPAGWRDPVLIADDEGVLVSARRETLGVGLPVSVRVVLSRGGGDADGGAGVGQAWAGAVTGRGCGGLV